MRKKVMKGIGIVEWECWLVSIVLSRVIVEKGEYGYVSMNKE